MCSAWIEPQINVRRPARRVMLTGAFLCLPLVAYPRQTASSTRSYSTKSPFPANYFYSHQWASELSHFIHYMV